ncbi:serine carboxypeptidase-like [Impatiens glandulifera]|uniref:serine carboxypeptidase-like n=1 Tax=Impatiens glandulifera TaxID=253017 RepID=UPI001FB06761|nr:serine carboxypeptidase-like [Impatiens glandulifera]
MAQRSVLILFPLFFFSCQILSSSSSSSLRVNNSQSREAERLIRSLNLFPSSGVNSGGNSSGQLPDAVLSSSLVEKQFRLPVHGPSIRNLGHYAGYYRLPHTRDARMFYLFFESRKNKRRDPVVIWLTGGPGGTCFMPMFYENGPYHITNNNSLIWNDFGWDQVSNLIYVDQPIGTGFSYSSHNSDFRNEQEGVSKDLYDFLQAFFAEHPQYLRNDFYIAGESYAGHTIPVLASRIQNGNRNRDGAHINLKGFAIGDGLVDAAIQHKAMPEYAKSVNLITESQAMEVSRLIPACERDAARCNARRGGGGDSCIDAHSSCTAIFDGIMRLIGYRNFYDIRKRCVSNGCYDFSYMEHIMNDGSVKEALGVGNMNFVSVNRNVYNAFLKDFVRNYGGRIPPLLDDGIKVLIYAGEYDLICNWIGNYWWVREMNWSGQRQFNGASPTPYVVDGDLKGQLIEYGPLSFLKVLDSGHMVPMDQPQAALEMLERWMKGTL